MRVVGWFGAVSQFLKSSPARPQSQLFGPPRRNFGMIALLSWADGCHSDFIRHAVFWWCIGVPQETFQNITESGLSAERRAHVLNGFTQVARTRTTPP